MRISDWSSDVCSSDLYIEDTAAEEGIDTHIRFQHRIVSAEWSARDARWHVTAVRTDTGETLLLTCGFLFSCSGYYRYDHGYQPDFPGADRFRGDLVDRKSTRLNSSH